MTATPLHFGESRAPLFGLYHAPAMRVAGAPAVLLFNPYGEEAIRAHKPLKVLADRLAGQGHPVMRFDYRGTGDSFGDEAEMDWDTLIEDADIADDELRAMSGASKTVWIGLRFGALVAMASAGEVETAPDGLILWEPVVDLSAHFAETATSALMKEAAVPGAATARSEVLGFAVPEGLLEMPSQSLTEVKRVIQAGGDAAPLPGAEPLDIGPSAWNSDAALNAYTVPAQAIRVLTEVLAAW